MKASEIAATLETAIPKLDEINPSEPLDSVTLKVIFEADLANVVKKCKAGKPLSKEDKKVLLKAAGIETEAARKDNGTFANGNKAAVGFRGYGKWHPKNIAMARQMAKHRLVDAEIAAVFGINESTLNLWKDKYKPFAQALKRGKESADRTVERSLYERAVGYVHEDVDIRTVSIGNGQSEIVQTPIVKHYPPETTACIFWLKNRQRQKWQDKTDVVQQNPDGTAIKGPIVHLVLPAGRAEGIMKTEFAKPVVTVDPAQTTNYEKTTTPGP